MKARKWQEGHRGRRLAKYGQYSQNWNRDRRKIPWTARIGRVAPNWQQKLPLSQERVLSRGGTCVS